MSRDGGDDVIFRDPEYRERYREKFLEAQEKGMDMVVYPDGAIALIENKVVMHTYGWHKKRRDFERTRATAMHVDARKRSVEESGSNVSSCVMRVKDTEFA